MDQKWKIAEFNLNKNPIKIKMTASFEKELLVSKELLIFK